MSFRSWYHSARATWATGLMIWVPLTVFAVVAIYVTWRLLEPAPPHKITIAAGIPGGAYDRFARQYAQHFQDNGFELEVRNTQGSVENYALLQDENSGVDVALVQGGTTPAEARRTLQAVCSVYQEPLWVFYRDPRPITRLSELRGKRLAVGGAGSGVRSLAMRLLQENGVDAGGVIVSDLTGMAAAEALTAGQVDVVFLVIAPESAVVQQLIRAPGVSLMSFAQSSAYARRDDFLSHVTLYRGVIDLGSDIPAADVKMIAPAAMLVARHGLHHGTLELLIRAAKAAHSGGTLLAGAGEFPSSKLTDLPVGKDAEYYLRSQPSRILGGLPFWLKSLIDRLVFLIIPLIAILVPLMRFAPVLFRWSVRSRITRYYGRLKDVEEQLEQTSGKEGLNTAIEDLDKLEHKISSMTIPAGFMPDLYDLRLHLDRLRDRLRHKMG